MRAERSLLPLASTRPCAPRSKQRTISECPEISRASREDVEYTRMSEEFVASATCVSEKGEGVEVDASRGRLGDKVHGTEATRTGLRENVGSVGCESHSCMVCPCECVRVCVCIAQDLRIAVRRRIRRRGG